MKTMLQFAAGAALAIALASTATRADDTGFASAHDWVKTGGRTCLADHAHSGSGDGATKDRAKAAAIRSWISFTALEYGSDWARYSSSVAQSVKYTKAETGWTAVVEGRPCRR